MTNSGTDNAHELVFPEGFESYEWQVESKGVILGARLRFRGKMIPFTFYDSTRLAQDVDESLRLGEPFLGVNLIVLKTVTRNDAVAAVDALMAGNALDQILQQP